jgi:hypothetical protein
MKKNNTLNNCFLSDCSTSDSRAVLGGITLQMILAGIMLRNTRSSTKFGRGDGGRIDLRKSP